MVNVNINRRKRVVEVLYFNEEYGTCLRVHKYNTDDELNTIKKQYDIV